MLRLAPLAMLLLLAGPAARQVESPASLQSDTVQAGDPALDPSRLSAFSIVRRMTRYRGDTAAPFGQQSEQLSLDTVNGQPVWLDVLTFETPRATTVDSSWIGGRTLAPLRLQSTNRERLVSLTFEGGRIRGRVTPATGEPTSLDQDLGVRPFEWNMFGLAVAALPLRAGYRATMPVYSDRFRTVAWYTVEVVRDTSLTRASGFRAPMWEVLATSNSTGPTARLWVSQRHRFVDQALLSEPGVTIRYARE